ncbi:unnamed product, partial [Ostreococcus tauri]
MAAAADAKAIVLASTCVLVATCATHFGAGRALWSDRGWRAWQPMRGRRAFVALQPVG